MPAPSALSKTRGPRPGQRSQPPSSSRRGPAAGGGTAGPPRRARQLPAAPGHGVTLRRGQGKEGRGPRAVPALLCAEGAPARASPAPWRGWARSPPSPPRPRPAAGGAPPPPAGLSPEILRAQQAHPPPLSRRRRAAPPRLSQAGPAPRPQAAAAAAAASGRRRHLPVQGRGEGREGRGRGPRSGRARAAPGGGGAAAGAAAASGAGAGAAAARLRPVPSPPPLRALPPRRPHFRARPRRHFRRRHRQSLPRASPPLLPLRGGRRLAAPLLWQPPQGRGPSGLSPWQPRRRPSAAPDRAGGELEALPRADISRLSVRARTGLAYSCLATGFGPKLGRAWSSASIPPLRGLLPAEWEQTGQHWANWGCSHLPRACSGVQGLHPIPSSASAKPFHLFPPL